MSTQVYLKLKRKAQVAETSVHVSDVADVFCERENDAFKAKTVMIGHVDRNKKQMPVSALFIVQKLQKELPGADFQVIGEEDCLVSYQVPGPWDKYLVWGKTAFVSVVLFFGAAFAIMTFNEDVSVAVVMQKIYELVTGESSNGNTILEWSYSLGLPVGILLFYNHFFGKKLTEDPTPLQVEMNDYEQKVDQTIIDLERAKERQK